MGDRRIDMADPNPDVEDARDFTVEGNDLSGYVGTDRIYKNYPDERMRPFRAEGGPDAEVEEQFYAENDEAESEGEKSETPRKRSGAKKAADKPPAPGTS